MGGLSNTPPFGRGCLLEHSDDVHEWSEIMKSISAAQVQFLESIIFAGNVQQILTNLKDILFANNGKFMKLLFQRFLYVATEVNQKWIALVVAQGLDTTFASQYRRLPKLELWCDVLHFILENKETCKLYATVELAKIIEVWINCMDKSVYFTEELAQLILDISEDVRQARTSNAYSRDDKSDQLIYRLALQSIDIIPDSTEEFIRKIISVGVSGTFHSAYDIWKMESHTDVDEAFEKCVFETGALISIMKANPELAKEVILAVIIEPYQEKYPFERFSDDDVFVKDPRYLHPNLWDRGPFYNFLNINSKNGAELIIDIVNFATDRWVEARDEDEEAGADILIGGKLRRLNGGYKVFYWYRGIVFNPPLVSSALMALEKWFYDKLENVDKVAEDVSKMISLIKDKMTSVALVGLLFEIGRFRPDIAFQHMLELFSIADLYYWESRYSVDMQRMGIVASVFSRDSYIQKQCHAWNTLEHRRQILIDDEILMKIYFELPTFKEMIDSSREHWQALVKVLESKSRSGNDIDILMKHDFVAIKMTAIKKYLHLFDISNYSLLKKEGAVAQYQYNLPEKTPQEKQQAEKFDTATEMLMFPAYCERILLGEETLHEGELEAFWNKGQRLCNTQEYFEQILMYSRDTIAQGMIAVIIKYHQSWLENYQEKANWIRTEFDKFSQHPYGNWGTLTERNVASNDEYTFWAQSIALLWIEAPDDRTIRQLVCNAATSWKYVTVRRFLEICYQHRSELGNNFYQLMHFILEWSRVLIRIPNDNRFRLDKISDNELNEWLNTEIDNFVKGEYPDNLEVDLPRDGKLIHYDRHSSSHDKIYAKEASFDYFFLIEVFKSIIKYEDATNSQEQSKFMSFWKFILLSIIERLTPYTASGEIAKCACKIPRPYDAESEIIEIIVNIAEKNNDFIAWQLIVDLGPAGENWIEDLFLKVFNSSINNKSMDMLINVLSYFEKSKCFSERDYIFYNLKRELLGLGRFMPSCHWPRMTNQFVNKLLTSYFDVGRQMLSSKHEAGTYISWLLNCEASKVVWLGILPILKEAFVENTNKSLYVENADGVAMILNKVWEAKDVINLQSNQLAYNSFKALLHVLCEINHHMALELRSKMV